MNVLPIFDPYYGLTSGDLRLREKVASAYSEEVAYDWLRCETGLEKDVWSAYEKSVLELLERNLPEKQFIKELRRLNRKLPLILY